MKKLILFASLCLILTSCMTTETLVGNYKEMPGKEKTFDKAKQVWIFWGILPLGKAHAETPSDGVCKVETKLTFGDFLLSAITGGVVTSYTIKVKTKQ